MSDNAANGLGISAAAIKMVTERLTGEYDDVREKLGKHLPVGGRWPVKANGTLVAVATHVKGKAGAPSAVVTNPAALIEFAAGGPVEADLIIGGVDSTGPGDNRDAVQSTVTLAEWYVTEVKARALKGEVIPGVEVRDGRDGTPYVKVVLEDNDDARSALVAAVMTEVRGILDVPPPKVIEAQPLAEPEHHPDWGSETDPFGLPPEASTVDARSLF